MTLTADINARSQLRRYFKASDFEYNNIPIRDMVVKLVPTQLARPYIASFHYSHTFPDSTKYVYAGYLGDKLCGIVVYGMGCSKSQYTALIPTIQTGQYVELTRLWCANDMPKNTESKLVSESLKLLPKSVKLVVSFADESEGHCGIIYQATNFYYCGSTSDGGKMMLAENGVKKHPRLLGIYKLRHPEYKKYSNDELMKLLHFTYTTSGRKFRYVYLRGTKSEKQAMYNQIAHRIEKYPKLDKNPNMLSEAVLIKDKF